MEEKHFDKKEFNCAQFEKMHSMKKATPQHSTEEGPSSKEARTKERLFEPLSHEARMNLFFTNDIPFDQVCLLDLSTSYV